MPDVSGSGTDTPPEVQPEPSGDHTLDDDSRLPSRPVPSVSPVRPKVAHVRQFLIDEIASNHSLVRAELLARGWREPSRAARKRSRGGPWIMDFLWTWSTERTRAASAASHATIINHFPLFDEIGSKVGLWKNLYALQTAVERLRAGGYVDSDNRTSRAQSHADAVAARHGDQLPDVHKFFPRCYLLARDPGAEQRSTLAIDQYRVADEVRRFAADFLHDQELTSIRKEEMRCSEEECAVFTTNAPGAVELEPWPQQPAIEGEKNIWIVKPSRAARGVDIRLFTNLTALLEFSMGDEAAAALLDGSVPLNGTSVSSSLSEVQGSNFASSEAVNHSASTDPSAAAPAIPSPSYIVQKYIERPLLVHGLKFDIRQFVLVTSLNPLAVFISDDFYLRFTGQPFTLANIEDRYIHLTNHQVQKDAPGFRETEIQDNQWSSQTFIRYLRVTYGEGTWKKIKLEMGELIVTAMLSWPATGHRDASFEVLGLDIMLDEDLRPWLLEINTNPGLHLLTDVGSVILDEREVWESLPEVYPAFLLPDGAEPAQAPSFGSLRLAYKGRRLS